MVSANQTFRGTASLEAPSTATIYNVTTPGTANTEISQALNAGTKQFTIRCRGNSKLQLSFVSGQSGTNYVTIPARSSYTAEQVNFSGTLYFQVDQPSQVVEILTWSGT